MDRFLPFLLDIYDVKTAAEANRKLLQLIDGSRRNIPSSWRTGLDHRDVVLITYADQVHQESVKPLQALGDFCSNYLSEFITSIHLLPFYPYSSDDGFSVKDYRQVDPEIGSWSDVQRLGKQFRLMFDAVINHASAQSDWFQRFLAEDPAYRDYFITVEGEPDLSQVVRPRALPLLHSFRTASGEKNVWTTFSQDQVDLNFRNPQVLLEIIDILLFYVARGATFIRLDAIAYLWKEIGTPCIHLPQTHRIIQLVRRVMDEVAPHVMLITETNVPHQENISYFGDGKNEAQLVYNFALPPLSLYTLLKGDASAISGWASQLELPSKQVTYFNFLASHDGIGVNPARGILSEDEIGNMVEWITSNGGLVSYKHNPDGSQSPYELNVNYFDALVSAQEDHPVDKQVDRFIAAHAMMLALIGMPGIYFHSLFGSRGWHEGVRQTGRNRTINRQKQHRQELEAGLGAPGSLRNRVFTRLRSLLQTRAACEAFHPYGAQQVLDCGGAVFGILRISPDGEQRVICLQNVTSEEQVCRVDFSLLADGQKGTVANLLQPAKLEPDSRNRLSLQPYQTLWMVVQ